MAGNCGTSTSGVCRLLSTKLAVDYAPQVRLVHRCITILSVNNGNQRKVQ
jgi:hypothetical protein